MTHDYQPWAGELAVQPVRCPCCGGESGVWQYVEKPGAEVLRVVMCCAPEFDDDSLPMLLSTCPLNMPHNSFYCQTARSAVAVWNRYAEALTQRRAAPAVAEPPAPLSDAQIRAVFLAHGFTIKDGQTDLKPYVYAAARALLAAPESAGEAK